MIHAERSYMYVLRINLTYI